MYHTHICLDCKDEWECFHTICIYPYVETCYEHKEFLKYDHDNKSCDTCWNQGYEEGYDNGYKDCELELAKEKKDANA